MSSMDINEVYSFVNENITIFHESRIKKIKELTFKNLIQKNPYLFRAKNVITAGELIESELSAFISSSEEKMFGDFLESLAYFVSIKTHGGHKSTAEGLDLEFESDGFYYVISIKSGTNWGNSSQHKQLEASFKKASTRLQQSHIRTNPRLVLGICYGKTKTASMNGYIKMVGQNFWTLISGDKEFYKNIIEPIGYRAKEHNESFLVERANTVNRLTKEFLDTFCDPESGEIRWKDFVAYNSGNYDLDKFFNH